MIASACYVQCDQCGDPAEISTHGAKDARVLAKRQGYIRIKRDGHWVDLCWRCQPEQACG